MPDIQLRFHRDTLVLSSDLVHVPAESNAAPQLATQLEDALLLDSESIEQRFRLEKSAGAACLCVPCKGLSARYLSVQAAREDHAQRLAKQLFALIAQLAPTHVVAEITPLEIPFDASSAASLREQRDAYAFIARALKNIPLDMVLLSRFPSFELAKCALVGIKKVLDVPCAASVSAHAYAGSSNTSALIQSLCDLELSVFGWHVPYNDDNLISLFQETRRACKVPLLCEFSMASCSKQQNNRASSLTFLSDALVKQAEQVYALGVQFFRVTESPRAALTAALTASIQGLDVRNTCKNDG